MLVNDAHDPACSGHMNFTFSLHKDDLLRMLAAAHSCLRNRLHRQ